MTGFTDVQATLMDAWSGGSLAYPVAYEGRDFTPPDNAPWIALHTMPVSVRTAAIGIAAPLEHVGLLQIDLNYPLNTGTGQPLADADTVAAYFSPGATFTHNGMRLLIESCDRSAILRDDVSETLYLTVKYRGWQHRT